LCIHIDVNDHNKVYCTLSSSGANQVYFTSNGGTTWTNISAGLTASPANTIVTQLGLSDVAYCGTDIGVFYRNPAVSTSWQPFNTGLPIVPVRDLEIQYNVGKIRAATFGRGVWESPITLPVLPVELVNFEGKLVENNVKIASNAPTSPTQARILLTWQTASEVRFHHFELERSNDSKTWIKLLDETAKGTSSSYQTMDEKPIFGVNYYRLKMIDTDGQFAYSKIVAIELSKPISKEWVLFPNPVKDKLFLSGNEDVLGTEVVKIVDIAGKILQTMTVQQLRNGLSINNLPNGIYFLDINNRLQNERKEFVVRF
jgi:Secretion system C-terminal sorting domain